MNAAQIRAVLDAHDALVRDCAEGRLTLWEFLSAYGDFPARTDAPEALPMFRSRVAFHRRVAGAIAGLRVLGDGGTLEGDVGKFMPTAGLTRLRDLVARYPGFEVAG
jgi:hypothetical protein